MPDSEPPSPGLRAFPACAACGESNGSRSSTCESCARSWRRGIVVASVLMSVAMVAAWLLLTCTGGGPLPKAPRGLDDSPMSETAESE
jgi:hypothetical protein